MVVSISTIMHAERMAEHFKSQGHPYMGVEVDIDGEWPVIQMWDDKAEHMRFIAVCINGASLPKALDYARLMADECLQPATAHAISEYAIAHDDEPVERLP